MIVRIAKYTNHQQKQWSIQASSVDISPGADGALHRSDGKIFRVTSFLLSQGTACSWILRSMIVTVTVSGYAQSANRGGFWDMCMQYCKHGDAEEDEENKEVVGKKKRHQSEQTTRVRREGESPAGSADFRTASSATSLDLFRRRLQTSPTSSNQI